MSDEKERAYADGLLRKAQAAAEEMKNHDQAEVDGFVEVLFRTAFDARIELAEAAVEETGLGVVKDKVQKNTLASLAVYRDIKGLKTVGVIAEHPDRKVVEVARPLGPILCMTPVTNPTSTVINKALICMKTRNPVIFAPHRAARKCSRQAAEILYEAVRKAGAPEGCIQWSAKSKWSYTEALMGHPGVSLVLATTAFHFVKEAHKSGNPCLGAGEGNVPVFVAPGYDPDLAARSIVESKTFDNGTVCCSEQCLVVLESMEESMRKAFQKEGGHFCSAEEIKKLAKATFDAERSIMSSEVVGQSAEFIARKAGFHIPKGIRILLAKIDAIGPQEPLSHEILAPVLAFCVVKDMRGVEDAVKAINRHHGSGHTLCIYSDDESMVGRLSDLVPAGRVLVNTPSSLGGLGGALNRLHPSLTLSCGGGGGNYTSDNITVEHLLEINRIARHNPDEVWNRIPDSAWLDSDFDSRRLDTL